MFACLKMHQLLVIAEAPPPFAPNSPILASPPPVIIIIRCLAHATAKGVNWTSLALLDMFLPFSGHFFIVFFHTLLSVYIPRSLPM